jgi:hypothetical protein
MIVCRGLPPQTQQGSNFSKCAKRPCYYLRRAVIPDWMGSTALFEDISQFLFQEQRNPLEHNRVFISDKYERVNNNRIKKCFVHLLEKYFFMHGV